MSRLFLMRHAQAGAGMPDAERSLTRLGEFQARSAGSVLRHLRPQGPPPLCSPARRCRQTASLLGAGEPRPDERLALDRPVRDLLDLARAAPSGSLLVGHQPELQGLLAALLPAGNGQPFSLPPGTLLGLGTAFDSSLLTLYLEPGDAMRLDAEGLEK
jgi:phosphohistidine phosphatase